jgi:serine/threonine protein kinase/Tfp pilus assembly protein PilF
MDDDRPTGPSEDLGTATADESSTATPQQIGPYRLLEKLGEGGMGEVWLAEQTEPVQRRVALKVIKQGMDTKQVVARFEAERQALAMMDHPAVAKVFDAGATPEGRPYFAMEHVHGVPITEFCDRHKLSNRERLELFVEVCAGVQHAHQKAIIHRDLKPTNVLVATQDGKRIPKIIDFGVAKATAQRLTERTVYTELGVMIGTPEYMSPEQAEMTGEDVDTRTDVYSLGVILYELLVGALPFDSKELRSAGFEGLRNKIREEEPHKPSTRLSTLGDQSTESAKLRRVDLPTLQRQLRGDLDWITIKALEKDRTRRYGSPMDLAADVERHLDHQPVLAGPPSTAYRARKFIRRHRFGVSVAALAVLALVGFAVTMSVLARRIALEREQVEAAKNDLEQVVEFQASMLSDLDVEQVGRRLIEDERQRVAEVFRERGETEEQIEARLAALNESLGSLNSTDVALRLIDEEILDRAGRTIDEQFEDQPRVAATLRQEIAKTYRELGLHDRARPYQESALSARRQLLGDDHPETMASVQYSGWLLLEQGDYEDAESYLREALEDRRRVLGHDHPDTLESTNDLGVVLTAQGRFEEATTYLGEALERRRHLLGDDHPDTLESLINMGHLLEDQGKLKEVEPYYREAVEGFRRVFGDDHPNTLTSMNSLGLLLQAQGKHDEAEPYLREALERKRRVHGDDHPSTLASIAGMGTVLYFQDRLKEAEPYFREVLDGTRRSLGDDHRHTLRAINNMGVLLRDQGKLEEAEPYVREAMERQRRVLGDEHPDTLLSISNLGWLLWQQGKFEEAEALTAKAVDAARRVLPREHFDTGTVILRHGVALTALGRHAEAEVELLEAHEILTAVVGADHDRTQKVVRALVDLYEAWDKPDKAEQWHTKIESPPPDRLTSGSGPSLRMLEFEI